MELGRDELFREAMSHLASGVAVVTARRADGPPCGIAATSLISYSVRPPSLLVSVWHQSRCHDALTQAERFVRYDHTILIGDLETGRIERGEPLVYARRRMDWLMQPMLD